MAPGASAAAAGPSAVTSVTVAAEPAWRSRVAALPKRRHSLLGRLKDAGVDDPGKYVAFFALRTWAQMADGALKTEMVYPHTKCMVITVATSPGENPAIPDKQRTTDLRRVVFE